MAFAQVHLRPDTPNCVSVSPSVELHRIYVERAFHGSGLARDLMNHVLKTADEHAAAIWLGVWEHNPRAIHFYQRFGFSEVGDQLFVVGTDPQRDLVLVRTRTARDRSPNPSLRRTPPGVYVSNVLAYGRRADCGSAQRPARVSPLNS